MEHAVAAYLESFSNTISFQLNHLTSLEDRSAIDLIVSTMLLLASSHSCNQTHIDLMRICSEVITQQNSSSFSSMTMIDNLGIIRLSFALSSSFLSMKDTVRISKQLMMEANHICLSDLLLLISRIRTIMGPTNTIELIDSQYKTASLSNDQKKTNDRNKASAELHEQLYHLLSMFTSRADNIERSLTEYRQYFLLTRPLLLGMFNNQCSLTVMIDRATVQDINSDLWYYLVRHVHDVNKTIHHHHDHDGDNHEKGWVGVEAGEVGVVTIDWEPLLDLLEQYCRHLQQLSSVDNNMAMTTTTTSTTTTNNSTTTWTEGCQQCATLTSLLVESHSQKGVSLPAIICAHLGSKLGALVNALARTVSTDCSSSSSSSNDGNSSGSLKSPTGKKSRRRPLSEEIHLSMSFSAAIACRLYRQQLLRMETGGSGGGVERREGQGLEGGEGGKDSPWAKVSDCHELLSWICVISTTLASQMPPSQNDQSNPTAPSQNAQSNPTAPIPTLSLPFHKGYVGNDMGLIPTSSVLSEILEQSFFFPCCNSDVHTMAQSSSSSASSSSSSSSSSLRMVAFCDYYIALVCSTPPSSTILPGTTPTHLRHPFTPTHIITHLLTHSLTPSFPHSLLLTHPPTHFATPIYPPFTSTHSLTSTLRITPSRAP